jgi:hypothetical protein
MEDNIEIDHQEIRVQYVKGDRIIESWDRDEWRGFLRH